MRAVIRESTIKPTQSTRAMHAPTDGRGGQDQQIGDLVGLKDGRVLLETDDWRRSDLIETKKEKERSKRRTTTRAQDHLAYPSFCVRWAVAPNGSSKRQSSPCADCLFGLRFGRESIGGS